MVKSGVLASLMFCSAAPHARAQQPPSISTRTNLVVVPTQVKASGGESIYGLDATQFQLKDNGVLQHIYLDDSADRTGLTLVVLIQCSGAAALEITKLKGLETMIDSVVGETPHQIATVSYGAGPTIVSDFTDDPARIAIGLSAVKPCREDAAATFDAVYYAARMLEDRHDKNRHAILLISEMRDHGSHSSPQEVIAALGRTNTVVDSVSYAPARDQLVRDLKNGPSGPQNWMPLFVIAVNAMRKNASSSLASLSGGEYANFGTQRGFDQALTRVANQIHNYYQLSFQPTSPGYGFHSISVTVPSYPDAEIKHRASYWFGTIHSPSEVP
jgi:VWFA-related protein